MIVRSWSARASKDKADHYFAHARTRVVPQLAALRGHKGALLLREERKDDVQILVLTFWESMDAIRSFAGPEPDVAVVEPEAQAVLLDYAKTAQHYDLVEASGLPMADIGGRATST